MSHVNIHFNKASLIYTVHSVYQRSVVVEIEHRSMNLQLSWMAVSCQ